MIHCEFWLSNKHHGLDVPLSISSMHAIPRIGDDVAPGEDSGKWERAFSENGSSITFWRVTRVIWFLDGTAAVFVIPICDNKEAATNAAS